MALIRLAVIRCSPVTLSVTRREKLRQKAIILTRLKKLTVAFSSQGQITNFSWACFVNNSD